MNNIIYAIFFCFNL